MNSDNKYFMVSVELLSAKHAIERVKEGLEINIVRPEYVKVAIDHLTKVLTDLYTLRNS